MITGAASGIGKIISHALHNAGCKITAVDLSLENLQKLKKEVHIFFAFFFLKNFCDFNFY